MRRRTVSARFSTHHGWTLLEVIVAVLCLLILLALIAPLISDARGPSRRLECIQNLKNLGIAVHSYAASHGDVLPALTDQHAGTEYGWPVALLPQLDANAVYRAITSTDSKSDVPAIYFHAFACPSDDDSYRVPNGLSYVVNAGYGLFRYDSATHTISEVGTHSAAIDLDGDGQVSAEELAINRATGVFWRTHSDGYRMTTLEIERGDGQGSTLLFAENLDAGTWVSTETMDLAFVIGRAALTFEPGRSAAGPLQLNRAELGAFGINANREAKPGEAPRPSANHADVVHVGFCDGRAAVLNVNIDPLVYARLMTPNGERFGQAPVAPADY